MCWGHAPTTSVTLQAKLNELNALAATGDKESFARAFVPLDLTEEDFQHFLGDLCDEEHWNGLAAEVALIAEGSRIKAIAGNQTSRAEFFFVHPIHENCDREVVFVNVGGQWRAEG